MKIKSIHIKNFKRFSDLTIQNIPETAKLVVLVGPNGCGKTSVFEAFNQWYKLHKWHHGYNDNLYLVKQSLNKPFGNIDPWNDISIEYHDFQETPESLARGLFYFRSAYRNEPDFAVSQLKRMGNPADRGRDNLMNTDAMVSENYQRVVSRTVKGVYSGENDLIIVKDLRKKNHWQNSECII